MRKLAADVRSLCFNFEDERLPETTDVLTELLHVIEESPGGGPTHLLFDEIHGMPGWGRYLRRLLDRGYHVFVTGSSGKLRLDEIPTELRGRTVNQVVYPLGFREYLRFKGIEDTSRDSRSEAALRGVFAEYLRFGGFPELCVATEFERRAVIQEYFRTMLRRDLIERHGLRQEALLESTIGLLLESLTVTISKLTNTLRSMGHACSKNAISDYILYLERSFFLHQSLIHSPKAKDRMQYPRKAYFVDNGFLRFLSLSAEEPRLLENLVAMEIVRRGRELCYWPGAKGEEVDIVLSERERPTQLAQVCHAMTLRETREREVRSLCRGLAELRLKEGLVLTFDTEETIRESGFLIYVRPAWKWLLDEW